MDAVMTWNYDVEHPELRALYEKAKREQWNATTSFPWTQDVDPEGIILDDDINPNVALLRDSDIWRRMTPKEQTRLRYETLTWNLSQFLHGEQLAIFVAGQLAAAVPWIDAKLYGSTQVVDEARHSEVFYRYLHEKLEHEYPLSDTTRGILSRSCTSRAGTSNTSVSRWCWKGWRWGSSPVCTRRPGNPSQRAAPLCAPG
jgi:hypothetical protein